MPTTTRSQKRRLELSFPIEIISEILKNLDDGQGCRFERDREFNNYSISRIWRAIALRIVNRAVFITNGKCACSSSECASLHPQNITIKLNTIQRFHIYSSVQMLSLAINIEKDMDWKWIPNLNVVIESFHNLREVRVAFYFPQPEVDQKFYPDDEPIRGLIVILRLLSHQRKVETVEFHPVYKPLDVYLATPPQQWHSQVWRGRRFRELLNVIFETDLKLSGLELFWNHAIQCFPQLRTLRRLKLYAWWVPTEDAVFNRCQGLISEVFGTLIELQALELTNLWIHNIGVYPPNITDLTLNTDIYGELSFGDGKHALAALHPLSRLSRLKKLELNNPLWEGTDPGSFNVSRYPSVPLHSLILRGKSCQWNPKSWCGQFVSKVLKGPSLRELEVQINSEYLDIETFDIDATPNLKGLKWVVKTPFNEQLRHIREAVIRTAAICPELRYIDVIEESGAHEPAMIVPIAETIGRQLQSHWLNTIGVKSFKIDLSRVRKSVSQNTRDRKRTSKD